MLEHLVQAVAVGHALVDLRLYVERIPGVDEEAVIKDETRSVGGSAANVAVVLRRLGVQSGIIGKIGLDDFGRIAVDNLMREGVDISGLRVSLRDRTGFSVVVRDKEGSITIYSFKGAAEKLEPGEIDADAIGRSKHVHVASLRPDTTLKTVEIAKKRSITVSWDPGRVLSKMGAERLANIISKVDIIFVNRNEAKNLTGYHDYRQAARHLKKLGPKIVVIKLGASGSYILYSDGEVFVPAIKPERVVDTTGAGDSYAAGFIAGLLRGYTIEKASLYATIVASIKVSRLGSNAAPSHEEVVEKARELGVEI
ncbi:ATP-dependent 6-phosphofructokinase [Aeropyrum pernix K1]|uniref:ATP-dependent 6-phosphofructokinase n=1 Tax=Aeropyrum pernix (strain ATCC 700893 / DSM 11879 / JCM 9820 / NBRC 100138 / K1) TaxID=272557 RepID=Q9YG89_AERPE|nr:carbohydrate kinase family protein [Aeropyrum pernix]BAA78921.1 ATP-dependent 6-phosphofructokinase [Aeropyrum pernix K1]